MPELFIRNASGDSQWAEDAIRICNSFAQTVRNTLRDSEEDSPVDLRDFQTVLKAAVDDVIHHEMVCRRLGTAPNLDEMAPIDENPNQINMFERNIDSEGQEDTW
jgi:hypothetical protein|tara:strand:+ start:13809 stop:14123 length:315 start_codon:yes stop_codon:yes gene_type:complete